jgi:hypothetical protein
VRRRHLERALEILVHGDVSQLSARWRRRALGVHRRAARWRHAAGVQGFGIALRETDGRPRRELVLRVYVRRKRPRPHLRHPVPRLIAVPGIPGRVRTDVAPVGELRLQRYVQPARPAFPGVDIGHVAGGNGTLGALVRRLGDGALCLLSNAHVLLPAPVAKLGDPIVQPSTLHGGGRPVALVEAAVPHVFSSDGFPNLVDAALARIVDPADVVAAIPDIGVPRGVRRDIPAGLPVRKTGAATGYTASVVLDPRASLALRYRRPDGRMGRVGFRDQVVCRVFTEGGDSGALVVDTEGFAVGLHVAGSGTISVFSRIDVVLDQLGAALVTGDGPTADRLPGAGAGR